MQVRTDFLLRLAVPALCCAAWAALVARADDSPRTPSDEIRLASGRLINYTIHFDRNSLRASVRVGDGLIALTSSGVLLRFELPAVRLVRERIDDEVTCIGKGEGETVLAGLADGRICRVDPDSLALTELTKLTSTPTWVGWCGAVGSRPAGMVALTRKEKLVERDGERWNEPYQVVNDLATDRSFSLDHVATAVLRDRTGRIWLGADDGEFGGRVSSIDLSKGVVTAIKPPPSREPDNEAEWEGICGFVELADGQVWAHGGTSHMGTNSGEITRVDEGHARTVFAFDPPRKLGQEPDQTRPYLPITHVIEEKNGLLVFSYSNVFRVDKAFKRWTRAARLTIAYRWGRPDAVGSYPAVQTVHPPLREGEPYLLATVGNGYVALDGSRSIPHGIPGQLAASDVSELAKTSEGMLFFPGDDQLPTWKLDDTGWRIAELAPPFESAGAGDRAAIEKLDGGWTETRVIVAPDRSLYTVSGTSITLGTRMTAHRVNGKTIRLGSEFSWLSPSYSFMTGDGTLWNACADEVRRFSNGGWELVQQLPKGQRPSGHLKTLNADGPPWLLHDSFPPALWRLDHGKKGENPKLTRLALEEAGKPVEIVDAIPWSGGELLLATRTGLRTFTPSSRMLSRTNLPEPPQPAETLGRDGLGRLWMATARKLYLLSKIGDKTLEAFGRVPWISQSEVYAIAPDPQHADGVILALGPRGVAFLRASQSP
jgi:hypothetical protein